MTEVLAPRKNNIIMKMFYYWGILILWQWVRPVANRSLADVLVKVGMFLIFILYAQKHKKVRKEDNWLLWLSLFLGTQIITILFDSGERDMGSIISTVFIFVQIIVFLVLISDDTIYESELERFCKIIIVVVLFMAIYNMIFSTSRFLQAFSSSGGRYGSECKSFLYSNHEFGIYLATGIIIAFWMALRGKLKYWQMFVINAILGANLFATYSRTAILGTVAAVFVLLFFYKKNVFLITLVTFAIVVAIIYANPTTRNIVFDKVLKGTFENGQIMDENRSEMYDDEWYGFTSADLFKQFFGYGYAGKWEFGGHNGYLQILLTGGIFMFAFFIGIILISIRYSFKTIRINRSLGSLMLGFQVFALLYMVAQTAILFYSTMDSFFITMTAILIPKYIYNHEVLRIGIPKEETTDEDHSD